MSFDAENLYNLLPAIYRIRDEERGGPLRALLSVIADEAVILDDNLAQLRDDMFIETCSSWALAYIGDLIGVEGLPAAAGSGLTPRAELANTIGYRRRKGTAAVLEQLARDVTGWPARAVEFFQLLATTQHMNHVRRENLSFVGVRDAARLEWLGTAFERLEPDADLPHTADVRRIAGARGRYNIPNVGLFVWRLRAYALTRSPAVPGFAGDRRRFKFNPLGLDTQLFNLPESETEMTQVAGPSNVPMGVTRRALDRKDEDGARRFDDDYDRGLVLRVERPGATVNDRPSLIPASHILISDLSDVTDSGGNVTGWAYTPLTARLPPQVEAVVDPERGRVAFVRDEGAPPLVTFHYGFSADVGGGEYDRVNSIGAALSPVRRVANTYAEAGGTGPSVQDALDSLGDAGGAVEIVDNGRYEERLSAGDRQPFTLITKQSLELRAGDKRRPTLVLTKQFEISGGDEGSVSVNGLLIGGAGLRVKSGLRLLRLRHCTIIAGAADARGPGHPPALVVDSPDVSVEIENCLVVGGLRVAPDAKVSVRNSVIDGTDEVGVAYSSHRSEAKPGGSLRVENSTVVGKVYASVLELASNSIFLARLGGAEDAAWRGPVQAEQRQKGCARFSYIPPGSRVPRRYRCQPEAGADPTRIRPTFNSLHYGDPDYCQLSARCPRQISRGADDESEMGVFHDLFQPQREAHLRARLGEYLRFGLEANILYVT